MPGTKTGLFTGKVGVFKQAVNRRFTHRQKLDYLPHTHIAAFGKNIVTVCTGFHDCTSGEQSVGAVIARNGGGEV